MAGHGFIQVYVGIDDLEEPKSIFVDVDTAEFSNFVGCISYKANEVTAEVCMYLRGIDIGKVVGARSNSTQGGNCAGANASNDMVEVLCGKKVVGLLRGTGEVTLLGVEFGVVGGRSANAVNDANIKGIQLCQMLSPFFNDGESNVFFLNQTNNSDYNGQMFVIGLKSLRTKLCWSVSLAVQP